MNEKLELWEILIPSTKPKSVMGKNRYFGIKYHRQWDAKIIAITNGLTILQPNKGQWLSPSGELCNERMIPVRIACTKNKIDEVMNITAKHYFQEAIMCYKISGEVIIKHYGN